MPRTDWGWMVTAEELESWTLQETDEVLVLNKPALVVCHPSKHGPWSSLIGACREYLGVERLHMPFRLDRETSGVLLFAKNHRVASRLQGAVLKKRFHKTYWAILKGVLEQPVVVREPIGRQEGSPFWGRQWVRNEGGQAAETEFEPLRTAAGCTLARVRPRTGRLHQIRVHAAWLGYPIVGDKLYPDPEPMLDFLREGYSERLAGVLGLNRHALHASEIVFEFNRVQTVYRAPLTTDLVQFCRERLGVEVDPAG